MVTICSQFLVPSFSMDKETDPIQRLVGRLTRFLVENQSVFLPSFVLIVSPRKMCSQMMILILEIRLANIAKILAWVNMLIITIGHSSKTVLMNLIHSFSLSSAESDILLMTMILKSSGRFLRQAKSACSHKRTSTGSILCLLILARSSLINLSAPPHLYLWASACLRLGARVPYSSWNSFHFIEVNSVHYLRSEGILASCIDISKHMCQAFFLNTWRLINT